MYQLISSFRLKTKVPLVSWLLSEFFPQKCSAQQFFASGQGRAGKGQTFTDQAFSVQGETTVNKWINARVGIYCFTNVYAQKWPNLAQNKHFGHFGPNIGLSGPFGAMPDQKTMQMRCLSGFLICGYQNFAPFKKLGYLAQKRPLLLPKNAFSTHIGLAGSFCALLVGWWVVAHVGSSIDRAYTLCAIQIGWQKLTQLLVVRLGAFWDTLSFMELN